MSCNFKLLLIFLQYLLKNNIDNSNNLEPIYVNIYIIFMEFFYLYTCFTIKNVF